MKAINSWLVKILIPILLFGGCSAATYEYASIPVTGSLSTSRFQTAYFLDGKNLGRFVWAGIEPATVKDGTITNDIIEPGKSFSKEISPLAKVTMAQRSDYGAAKTNPVSTAVFSLPVKTEYYWQFPPTDSLSEKNSLL